MTHPHPQQQQQQRQQLPRALYTLPGQSALFTILPPSISIKRRDIYIKKTGAHSSFVVLSHPYSNTHIQSPYTFEKMSLLPPEVHTALSQLLRALITPDNTIRTQAEDQLNNDWIQNRPDVLLMGLVEQTHGSEDAGVSPFYLAP